MSARDFLRKFIAPLTAESLRALTSILLWSLALIVPGVIMYCRLSFVPFVVILDPTYHTKPDALARCRELTRDCWMRLTFFLVALGVIDLLFELAPGLLNIESWMIRIPFDFCGFLFSLFSFLILYVIFDNLRLELDAGASGSAKWN